jgi:hypothetical protein
VRQADWPVNGNRPYLARNLPVFLGSYGLARPLSGWQEHHETTHISDE